MLRIRPKHAGEDNPWREVAPQCRIAGLTEDTDYLIDTGAPEAEVFIDDVPLQREGSSTFSWRPSFYAGVVALNLRKAGRCSQDYLLDVSPSPNKSGQDEFADMVKEIRDFDQSLLGGLSSATIPFGHSGRKGRYELDVLLYRIRTHGPTFLDAVTSITRAPHRFLAADRQVLPLSRVRKLHHTALLDRRVAMLAVGQHSNESIDSFQINGLTSAPTFDTPANRTLLGLVRRFEAAVTMLSEAVQSRNLESQEEEQTLRAHRRLLDLEALAHQTRKLLHGTLFREVSSGETSAAGLTQISAQPQYSRAYRLGCRALGRQLEGIDSPDQLHIPPSWGIYETWCFLRVVASASQITCSPPVEQTPQAVAAERAVRFDISHGRWLEVLFQATFPSLKKPEKRMGWSLSGERRPDIVFVHHTPLRSNAVVLDAKWRSGRTNVLQAMESAHIYHDALRVNGRKPHPCLLLLPGSCVVDELEQTEFVKENGVGAVSLFKPSAPGVTQLEALMSTWLEEC